LKRAENPRVVNVSAKIHTKADLDLNDLNSDRVKKWS